MYTLGGISGFLGKDSSNSTKTQYAHAFLEVQEIHPVGASWTYFHFHLLNPPTLSFRSSITLCKIPLQSFYTIKIIENPFIYHILQEIILHITLIADLSLISLNFEPHDALVYAIFDLR